MSRKLTITAETCANVEEIDDDDEFESEYGGDITNRTVRMSRLKRMTETLGDDP